MRKVVNPYRESLASLEQTLVEDKCRKFKEAEFITHSLTFLEAIHTLFYSIRSSYLSSPTKLFGALSFHEFIH
jgi:hypothetical protein